MLIDVSLIEKDLKKIQKKDQENSKVVFNHLTYLKNYGRNVSRPKADHVTGKIYELRPGDYRLLYAYLEDDTAVALVLYAKKESAIQQRHIQLAKKRLSNR